MNHNLEFINFALKNSGLSLVASMEQVKYLGAGAWHRAYLVMQKNGEKLVIRFPKVEAYGKKVEFNEKAVHAEYGGTKLYYKMANEVMPGICPDFYDYHCEEGKTYTIETYMGEQLVLEGLEEKSARQVGAKLGELFRGMNEATHSIKGFGYLSWNGSKVEGELQTDVAAFMEEENAEYMQDYQELSDWDKSFASSEIKAKLDESLTARKIDKDSVAFTNQDTSPENIIFTNGKVGLIDPVPILYYGHSFAGNSLNNFEVLYPTLYNSPRYEKHHFHRFQKELQDISSGFLDGYSQGSGLIKQLVKREQFLQLFQFTFNHYKLATGELKIEQEMRYGNKAAVTKRIPIYCAKLKNFLIE